MSPLSRRKFSKLLLAATVLPAVKLPLPSAQAQTGTPPVPSIPETIAGHTLSAEERDLAAAFLAGHEKGMSPVRTKDLPNSLSPDFIFKSPVMRKGKEGSKR